MSTKNKRKRKKTQKVKLPKPRLEAVVDYSKAPEEWCLAEFISTLPTNGDQARSYLKDRGYVMEVPKRGLPERSPMESVGLRVSYGPIGK